MTADKIIEGLKEALEIQQEISAQKAEPAKAWRNWWKLKQRTSGRCGCGARSSDGKPGTILKEHCRTYPTKDVAETKAAIYISNKGEVAEYLGAFPIGERP